MARLAPGRPAHWAGSGKLVGGALERAGHRRPGCARFAGQMDKDDGVFTPAGAGTNPGAKYQTNNAGNLKVIASVDRDGQTIQGDGHLIVTVQRWNNPPIR